MSAYKLVFIINPISGGGEGKRIFRYLPEIMSSFGYQREDWHAEFTDPTDMVEQVRRLVQLTEKMIAVGGDGTMNLVMSIVSGFDVEVGLIPLGTGNDLSRAWKIYDNFHHKGLLNTIRKLINARSKLFDLWKVNGEVTMAAYISMGIDARVASDFDNARREGRLVLKARWYNKLQYLLGFFRVRRHQLSKGALVEYQTVDGKWHRSDLTGMKCCIVGNIPSYAGGSNPFCSADYSDKLLEIVRAKGTFAYGLLVSTTLSPLWQRLVSSHWVPSRHASKVRLHIPEGEFLQIDGEDYTGHFKDSILEIEHLAQVRVLTLQP